MSQDICARCGINQAVVGSSDGGVCGDCIRMDEIIFSLGEGNRSEIRTTHSRLEAALRGVFLSGSNRAWWSIKRDGREPLTEDQAVARALEDLSRG